MNFLHEFWAAWNNQWGATVATILGITAIAMNAGEKFQGLASFVARWRVWATIRRLLKLEQNKYRIRRTKGAMKAKLAHSGLTITIQQYQACLTENQSSSRRNELEPITPEKPSWLNDYYVATALEEMSMKGEIAKCEMYGLSNTWPPSVETYLFLHREPGKTIEEQAEEVTSESRCRVEQFPVWRDMSSCSEETRFDIVGNSETTAPGTTIHSTKVTLKPKVPPCKRCWMRKQRKSDIRQLVDSITEYDLSHAAPVKITGMNQEFQESVIEVCIASRCSSDTKTVKEIVEQAIKIRANQIANVPVGHEAEWTGQLTENFTSSLRTYIQTKLEWTCL